MARGFTVPTTFTAVDKFSGTVNAMIGNTNKFERQMKRISVRSFEVARGFGAMGLAIATPLALAVREAVKFEDKMADVAKVANVAVGSEAFKTISEDAKELGVNLGVGAIEAAGLMANIAQGGTAIEDLNEVSMIAGKVGVAFGISADLAGESFIKTKNALGGTIQETERLMDSINLLGNTTSASSDQILTFMSNGGSGVARAAGASGEALAAYGSQFISMGKSGEEAATIMERFIRTSLNTKSLRGVFDDAGGGADGMFAIIEKGAKLSGVAQDKYFKQFGNYGLSIQLMAKNYDQLKEKIDASTDSTATADSVLKEFENRTNTTGFKLDKAKEQFRNVAITLGTSLLPAITDVIKAITPMVQQFADWTKNNPELTAKIVKTTAVVAGLALGISGLGYVIGGVTKALAIMGGPVTLTIAAVGALTYAVANAHTEYNALNSAIRINEDATKTAMLNTMDQRIEVDKLFKALENSKVGTDDYKKALGRLEEIQPGVTKRFNLDIESLAALKGAYNSVTDAILRQAKIKALNEMSEASVKAAMTAEAEGPGVLDYFQAIGQTVGTFGMESTTPTEINNDRIKGHYEDAKTAANQAEGLINPKQTWLNGLENAIKERIEITINNNSDSEVSTSSTGMASATTSSTI